MKWALVGALIVAAGAAVAQDVASVLDLVAKTTHYSDATISPNGARVAWTQGRPGAKGKLFVAAVGGQADPKEIASGERDDSEPAFSPDSKRLAYFSSTNGQKSLVVTSADGAGKSATTALSG